MSGADITSGTWHYEPVNPGSYGSKVEPPDPGYPGFIWADTEYGEIPIATLDDPIYHMEPKEWDDIGWPDDGVRFCGDMNANGRLLASAKCLLEALVDILENIVHPLTEDGQDVLCGFCGRVMDEEECQSDDCLGVKARAIILQIKG